MLILIVQPTFIANSTAPQSLASYSLTQFPSSDVTDHLLSWARG